MQSRSSERGKLLPNNRSTARLASTASPTRRCAASALKPQRHAALAEVDRPDGCELIAAVSPVRDRRSPCCAVRHAAAIAEDGDGAWIAWVDDGRDQQKLRYGRLAGDRSLQNPSSPIGELDSGLGRYHNLQRVGRSAVALWTDVTLNRSLTAMRVCF
jgi:hypothetical protein